MLSRPDSPTRRDFLAGGLAAASALTLGGSLIGAGGALAAPSRRFDDYGPFKMGLQSYSLRHFKLAEALEKTKALGVHFWESYSAHTNPDPAKAAEYKTLTAAAGVRVGGFGVSGFSKDHDANRRYFEFGKAMGVDYLSADPDHDPATFASLDKLVAEYNIAIGIHPHGPGAKWVTIDQIQKAISGHHEKIGVCLDTGHFLRAGQDPVAAVATFGKRIYGVHLKDVKGGKTFTILGEGDLKLGEFLQGLADVKYSHCMALEYEENERNPIADIEKCLTAVRNALDSVKV